ncbi:hypothetical protein QBC33DRAFT_564584 [Phialemonium atrogriseum]|uniref:Uncharacterized protein n=1 Tax=Phialemonium atrogriseum TaxID=1093897 RepID=A0AAJ0BNL9_9PEZI|nr:uncharacterized protein QBC33DRAFT_564584 [Phialemonium atrogriseum]KAK1761618.1 hypothetical protein QBC33DRAFT_564584 [Phialemonium atrogriseum]
MGKVQVQQLFMRTKTLSPFFVFHDKMDAIVPRRNDNLSNASACQCPSHQAQGVLDCRGIYVIGTTN